MPLKNDGSALKNHTEMTETTGTFQIVLISLRMLHNEGNDY